MAVHLKIKIHQKFRGLTALLDDYAENYAGEKGQQRADAQGRSYNQRGEAGHKSGRKILPQHGNHAENGREQKQQRQNPEKGEGPVFLKQT
jgi:hypothetical protein